jgi:hypothetical protein
MKKPPDLPDVNGEYGTAPRGRLHGDHSPL